MDVLSTPRNFRSLSLKDLLEARDQFHFHLMNKASVVVRRLACILSEKATHGPASTNPPTKTLSSKTKANGHLKIQKFATTHGLA